MEEADRESQYVESVKKLIEKPLGKAYKEIAKGVKMCGKSEKFSIVKVSVEEEPSTFEVKVKDNNGETDITCTCGWNVNGEFKEAENQPNQKFQSLFGNNFSEVSSKVKDIFKGYFRDTTMWVATTSVVKDARFKVVVTVRLTHMLNA